MKLVLFVFIQIVLCSAGRNSSVVLKREETTESQEGFKWCDLTNYGQIVYMHPDQFDKSILGVGVEEACVYKVEYSDYYHGFFVNQDDPNVDVFDIYYDCCGPHSDEKDLTKNVFNITDTRANQPKKMNFIFTAEEWKRSHQFFYIYNNVEGAPWTINTNNMISKQSFVLGGTRSYDEAKKNPYRIEASTSYFNITTHPDRTQREVVYLNYTWGYSPYVNVSGNVDVYLSDEADRNDCQYRYTAIVGENDDENNEKKGVRIMSEVIGNKNVQAKVVCKKGNFKRVAVCGSYFLSLNPDYEDCGCSYEEYEYGNKAIDCTYLSDMLEFQPAPVQDIFPVETKWGGFVTKSDTEINIPKGLNLTIAVDVTLPENNMLVSGDLYFEQGIILEKTDVLYDLGNFRIGGSFDATKVKEANAVLFVGQCFDDYYKEPQTCEKALNDAGMTQQDCGGLKKRFVKEDSDPQCYCEQNGKSTFVQSDCNLFSTDRQYKFDLHLTGTFDGGINTKRYWNSITFVEEMGEEEIEYIAGETRVYGTCDFSKVKTMKFSGSLTCEKLIVGGETKIIGSENSLLKTYDIEIVGDVKENVNGHAMFRFGKGTFQTDGSLNFVIDGSVEGCFEFATTSGEFDSSLNEVIGRKSGSGDQASWQGPMS